MKMQARPTLSVVGVVAFAAIVTWAANAAQAGPAVAFLAVVAIGLVGGLVAANIADHLD